MANIRIAALEDSDAIAQVHIDAWRESYKDILPEAMLRELSVPDRAERWRQIFREASRNSTYNALFLAEEEGQIVGFASGGPCRGVALGQGMEVYAIYLLDRVKRHGIGGALLKTLMNDFLLQGASSAGLWVLRDNLPARRFYEKFGARVATEKIDSRPDGDLIEVGYVWPDIRSVVSI